MAKTYTANAVLIQ